MYSSNATSLNGNSVEGGQAGAFEWARTWGERLVRSGWLLPLLLSLPALIPLLHPGFYVSDDGLFHVYRIAGLTDAWQQGVLYPRLFPQFGFGYGQAVFNYYAPFSYVPGALVGLLGMAPAPAAELSVALGFVLAALAAYGMGRYLWGWAGGAVACVVYTYFPYHLADAYLRGALPEHMAFVFPPLIIWATVAAFREEHPVPSYLWGALCWAGLAYTHNLTLLLMVPVWLVLVLLLGVTTGKWRRFWGAAGGVALAIGLSAWLWLPFLAESNLVGIGLGPSDGSLKHLAPLQQLLQTLPFYQYRISHGTGLAEHPVGWPALLVFVVVIGWLGWRLVRRQPPAGAWLAMFGLLLALWAAFMTASPALPVWKALLPVLAQLQYPWRFMTLVALGLAIAVGAPFSSLGRSLGSAKSSSRVESTVLAGLGTLIGLAFMLNGLVHAPAKPLQITAAEAWSPARMWAEDAAAGQVGATWTGEFLPQTVKEQRWALGRPLEGAQDSAPLTPAPQLTLEGVGYDRLTMRFESDAPGQVRLHQFQLPAWKAWADGVAQTTYPSGELGLVTLDVPTGRSVRSDAPTAASRISFRFGPSRAVMAASLIVIVAAAAWAVLAWSHRWRVRRRDHVRLTAVAPLLVLLVAVLAANISGLGVRTRTPNPVASTAGDFAQLVAYEVMPARGERALDVTLYWFALRETSANYKVFVHLLGPDGQVRAQHDGDPVEGYTPTTRWKQGELIADTHRLPLPPDVMAGDYQLRAGMYEIGSGDTPTGEAPGFRNLPLTPATEDGRISLGPVIVH